MRSMRRGTKRSDVQGPRTLRPLSRKTPPQTKTSAAALTLTLERALNP